jgi:hypothetical protein
VKRPAGQNQEQHLRTDNAYDATDARKFVASEGSTAHIGINSRRKGTQSRRRASTEERLLEVDPYGEQKGGGEDHLLADQKP